MHSSKQLEAVEQTTTGAAEVIDISELGEQILAERRVPSATYRFQFNSEFTFRDAQALIPYLDDAGHQRLLRLADPARPAPAAPTATTSATTRQLNPALGGDAEFDAFAAALRAARHGPDPRRRAQPHGHRRRQQRLVDGRAGERPQLALRRLLRHRLAPGQGRAGKQGAAADPRATSTARVLESGELRLVYERGRVLRCTTTQTQLPVAPRT